MHKADINSLAFLSLKIQHRENVANVRNISNFDS